MGKVQKIGAYKMERQPIILKQLLVNCDIPQGILAELTGLSRPTINLAINRGYVPKQGNFKAVVEEYIGEHSGAQKWLVKRGYTVEDIWHPLGKTMHRVHPRGQNRRISAGARKQACVPGNPEELIVDWEVEMITQEAMKHFKVFKNPFIDDIQKEGDVYMSEEHRYIEEAMKDAARHGGFLAVIGEVGSGKSVMRKKVVEQLRRDGDVLIIFPQVIDKNRVNAGSICDAIVMDLSDQKPKVKLEVKARQVQKLLLERSKQGYRAVLIIEEAHDLHQNTLKYLKRFYELEDGYKKLLGIILIGQTELREVLNEETHIDMREVIRRIQVAEIKGLNGHLKDYLSLKFKRVGRDIGDIMTEESFDALKKRMTMKDRNGKTRSHAYPLLVNNYVARGMNLAYEMGETKVTGEVINGI